MQKPRISIVSACYNHERFIVQCIESVLAQECPDFEWIIVDDGSSDNTVDVIRRYNDPRIRLIEHPYNQGINAAFSTGFERAVGDYVTLLGTDDALKPNHISSVNAYLLRVPEVQILYSPLIKMDFEGVCLPKDNVLNPLEGIALDRASILRHLFFRGNCLCSPALVVKRTLLATILPLPRGIFQYHDYQIHIRLLLLATPHFRSELTYLYRVPSEKSGASAISDAMLVREKLETALVLNSFLEYCGVSLANEVFGDRAQDIGPLTEQNRSYFFGRLALKSEHVIRQEWGLQTIRDYLSDRANLEYLHAQYGFSYRDYLELYRLLPVPQTKRDGTRKYRRRFQRLVMVTLLLSGLLLVCAYHLIVH